MLMLLQALIFTTCVLIDALPSTEVDCRFDARLIEVSPAPTPVPPPPDQTR